MKNNYLLLYFLYFLIITGYYLLIFKDNKLNISKIILLVSIIIFLSYLNNKPSEGFVSAYNLTHKLYKNYNSKEEILYNKNKNKINKNNYKLIEKNKLYLSQGVTYPLKPDINKYKKSLDNSNNSPNDMFMFAYNKCKPECCLNGSSYSCSSGCVCVNNNQIKLLSTRGNNV